MELVSIVAMLVLFQYLGFVRKAGSARGRFGVPAPATTGNEDFERQLRVQSNTVEQLVVFLPTLFLFAHYVHAETAAGLGLIFLLGRGLYARAYVVDPANRGPGFLLTIISNLVLTLGSLVGASLRLLSSGSAPTG